MQQTNDMELALSSRYGLWVARVPGGKIWKSPCAGPEVPYTVQTHFISTLLCKLVSRRIGGVAYHMGVAWIAEHQQTGQLKKKKTCTSWWFYMSWKHSCANPLPACSIFISTFIGEFHIVLFFLSQLWSFKNILLFGYESIAEGGLQSMAAFG